LLLDSAIKKDGSLLIKQKNSKNASSVPEGRLGSFPFSNER
jgi:hypothetical protein